MKHISLALLSAVIVALVASFHASANTTNQRLESESMTRESGSQDVWSDSTASAGKKRILWSNGAVYGNVTTTKEFSEIQFRAKGNRDGSTLPKVNVWVNKALVSTVTLNSDNWKTYSVKGSWPAGSTRIYIEYRNDYRDRDVVLDYAETINSVASTPTPPTPAPDPSTNRPINATHGIGGNYQRDVAALSYTDKAGVTSQYNLFGAHLSGSTAPRGVLISMHGDSDANSAPYWYSSVTGGEIKNHRDLAREHNLYHIVPRTPDRSGSQTWWNEDSSSDWLMNLLDDEFAKKHNIDLNKVYFIGHSGGADSISEDILNRHSSKYTGGGAVMTGGGSFDASLERAPSASLKNPDLFSAHWVVGNLDDGRGGTYNALKWGKLGHDHWKAQGLTTTHTIIQGGTHDNVTDDGTASLRTLLGTHAAQ